VQIEDITMIVIDALNAAQIPYVLVGSFSSNYYGIPRSTQDADLVIELAGRPVTDLKPHLPDSLHLDPQLEFETITFTKRNVITIDDTVFKVELFRLSDDAHDQERFRRRVQIRAFGRDIQLPTAEDVIVTKLRWLRRKDVDDLESVIGVQGNQLDWDYIHYWCDQHGTRQMLDDIRSRIPPIES